MEYKDILVTVEGAIGFVTLNNPHTANALSKNTIGELIHAFESFRNDDSVRVVIVKANGKHFCSGHNLSEMIDAGMAEAKYIFDRCTDMMTLIHEIPQTVIIQVRGVATAAGCQLTAAGDLAFADESARFATPGVRIGLFCSTPMVELSRAVGRKLALEMLLTGRFVSAEEAERHGLINRVVPAAELEATVLDTARTIAEASPLVLGIGKRGFYAQIELDQLRAYEWAKSTMTMNLMAEDAQEGIKAFLAKRKPDWVGK
ncbi:MAG: enoyl-CoA hydratase [Pseudomonadota bacterium]